MQTERKIILANRNYSGAGALEHGPGTVQTLIVVLESVGLFFQHGDQKS